MKRYDYIKLPIYDIWGVIMRKDSPLSKFNKIRPKDLVGLPLIYSRQALAENELAGWIGENTDKLNIVMTYNLVNNAALMVSEGIGYALTFDKILNTSGNSDICFRPLEPILTADFSLVWKKYQIFSRAAEKFIEKMHEEFGRKK